MPLCRHRFAAAVFVAFVACVAASALVWATGGEGAAWAQADVAKVADRLNKKAMDDFDNLEFDSAKQTLQSAVAKLRDASLDETPTAARIYVSLGMVYFIADKDRNRAVNQFAEALKIDGTITLDPERATPELQELFAEAQKRVGKGGAAGKRPGARRPAAEPPPPPPPPVEPPPPEEPPEPPVTVHGLVHNSVDEAKAGDDIPIRVQMGQDVMATRLFLFYRSGGQEDYTSVTMVKRGGEWTGTIPGDAIAGRTCQYYIEARDARGRPAVASGSAASPYIVTIAANRNGDEPGRGGDRDREDPLAKERRIVEARRRLAASERGWGHLFFNVMVGTGVGFEPAGNQYEVAYMYKPDLRAFAPVSVSNGGTAWSGLHGAFELGYNVNRHIALSGIARLQGTLLNNADSSSEAEMSAFGGGTTKATTAFAGLLRFRYNFGEGRFRPGLHLGVGGGQIRHVLDITSAGMFQPLVDLTTAQYYQSAGLDPYDKTKVKQPPLLNYVCQDKNPCYDNIAIGYILASVGGSLYYDLTTFRNGGFGLILDVAAIFAFGQQFGVNLDVQAGIGGHFL